MPVISASLDIFLSISIITISSYAWITRRQPPQQNLSTEAGFQALLNIFVLLHTLFILYILILKSPPNLFTRLRIPLTTSSEAIRTTLLRHAGVDSIPTASLPKHLETLLTRLSSFDARNIYVRFGQSVLQDCEYCHTYYEYAVYAVPRPLLGYVRETAITGLLTVRGSHKERWRTYAIGAIACAAVAEQYWVSTVQIKIPNNGMGVIMWHDVLWTYRHIFFLALPILLRILPSSRPSRSNSPTTSIPVTLDLLEKCLTRIHLLKFTRGSIMRNSDLRASATDWWEQERKEGEWVREDESVQKMAERLGFGYGDGIEMNNDEGGAGEGKLKHNAKNAVEALKNGFRPIEVL